MKASVYLTLGRMSTSLEETFFIIAVPDQRVPMPSDEDLPKVCNLKSQKSQILLLKSEKLNFKSQKSQISKILSLKF